MEATEGKDRVLAECEEAKQAWYLHSVTRLYFTRHIPACQLSPAASAGPAPSSSLTSSSIVGVVDLLVRRRAQTKPPMEVRVAVIGNVDSGKSTLVGVLTRSQLDDGRGLARSKVRGWVPRGR
jgi:polynucleotide 5'-kinase involved in rRNA processing